MGRRLSTAFAAMNLRIDEAPAPGGERFVIKDVFTTIDGSWEPDGRLFSVPVWARASYLRPLGALDYFDEAGATPNLFARIEDEKGKPLALDVLFKSSGGLLVRVNTFRPGKRSGWCELFMEPSSSFNPERGVAGPWSIVPENVNAETIVGCGRPFGWHVSTFVVWQLVSAPVDPEKPPVDPPGEIQVIKLRIERPTRLEVEALAPFEVKVGYGK